MTVTISKYQLSKQQHTITLNYTIGENLNHFSHLCRNFFPRIGMRFVKHEMVWLLWQPGPSKKLGASSLDYSQRKNNKYMVEYDNKKIHFGSANSEDYLTHKDPVRRDKYLTKAKKISNKDGQLTHLLPSYPNYWSVKLLN